MGRLILRDMTTVVLGNAVVRVPCFRLVAWLRLCTIETGDSICRANTPRPQLIEADMVSAETPAIKEVEEEERE